MFFSCPVTIAAKIGVMFIFNLSLLCPCIYIYEQKVSVHLTITVQKTDDLKRAITEFIRNVDSGILNTIFENTVRRVNKRLETGGGHFEHCM